MRLAPIVLGLMLASAGAACGQALEVAPTTIQLAQGQQTATLTVVNRSAQTTIVQARAFGWTQPEGVDRLLPTRALGLSPPIVSLPPGEAQLVRIVLRTPAGEHEDAYRILIDQLPPPASANSVNVALRISLPIFAEPQARAAAALAWSFVMDGRGGATLIARNDGRSHAKLASVGLSASGVTLEIVGGGQAYLLPGAEHRWTVHASGGALQPGGQVSVTAVGEQGRITATPRIDVAPAGP